MLINADPWLIMLIYSRSSIELLTAGKNSAPLKDMALALLLCVTQGGSEKPLCF